MHGPRMRNGKGDELYLAEEMEEKREEEADKDSKDVVTQSLEEGEILEENETLNDNGEKNKNNGGTFWLTVKNMSGLG